MAYTVEIIADAAASARTLPLAAAHASASDPVPASRHVRVPLVTLKAAGYFISAGTPGGAQCTVRLLDQVDFELAPRELVVLRDVNAASLRALLGVLAGDVRYRKQMTGERTAATALEVRRGVIHADEVPYILAGWWHEYARRKSSARSYASGWSGSGAEASPPQLVLLRVSRSAVPAAPKRWLRYARSVRTNGGAIVIAEHTAVPQVANAGHAATTATVHTKDPAAAPQARDVRFGNGIFRRRRAHTVNETALTGNHVPRPGIRLIQLAHGRLLHGVFHGGDQP